MNQNLAPLLQAAQRYLEIDHAAFYMPAHKRGQSIDRELQALMGANIFRLDLPELPDLEEPIALAEELAADAYGSDLEKIEFSYRCVSCAEHTKHHVIPDRYKHELNCIYVVNTYAYCMYKLC